MLVLVTRELDHKVRLSIMFAAIIIFVFRATPSVGDGYTWFSLDVLNSTRLSWDIWARRGDHCAGRQWFMSKQPHRTFGGAHAVLDHGA